MADVTCSVVEDGTRCSSPVRCRGWCARHYNRWLKHGDPLTVVKRGKGALLVELRAAGRATTDECIILATRSGARPVAKHDGKLSLASRVVWVLAKGDPGEMHVLHTCHRGDDGCINIRHLYLGTNEQNVRDMVNAGRNSSGRLGRRKITPEQVHSFRERHQAGGVTVAELAAEAGVSYSTVSQAVRGVTWKTLT